MTFRLITDRETFDDAIFHIKQYFDGKVDIFKVDANMFDNEGKFAGHENHYRINHYAFYPFLFP